MTEFTTGETDFIRSVRNRVSHSLDNQGLLIDLSTDQCKKYLRRKINSKTSVVIMYVDMTGSTQMAHDITSMKMSLIIQIFSQEVSLAVSGFGGYVLKYVGDAVIVLFPAEVKAF
jgi:class 3 adenylate cyclase